jgi:hypothetical protein
MYFIFFGIKILKKEKGKKDAQCEKFDCHLISLNVNTVNECGMLNDRNATQGFAHIHHFAFSISIA